MKRPCLTVVILWAVGHCRSVRCGRAPNAGKDVGDDSCGIKKIVRDGLRSCHYEFLCFGTVCMMP